VTRRGAMKVLFLDMDGVLVTQRPSVAEPNLVENLKYIINTTGARIVLSSDWRRTKEARAEVRRILQARGMDFISCTPQHGSPYSLNRATEVLAWVEDHNAKCRKEGKSESELVETFVAIDDRPLIHEIEGSGLVGHFVMTHIRRGLTRAACEAAIKCLENKQDIPAKLLPEALRDSFRTGRARVVQPAAQSMSTWGTRAPVIMRPPTIPLRATVHGLPAIGASSKVSALAQRRFTSKPTAGQMNILQARGVGTSMATGAPLAMSKAISMRGGTFVREAPAATSSAGEGMRGVLKARPATTRPASKV